MPTPKGLFVLTAGKEKKVLSQVNVGATIYATPVVANGTLDEIQHVEQSATGRFLRELSEVFHCPWARKNAVAAGEQARYQQKPKGASNFPEHGGVPVRV